MFQIDININYLLYYNLPANTLAERLTKAKLIAGFTQKTLAASTGLSLSTVTELEAGYRNVVSIDTLQKLLLVLDKNILCDDYLNFILNQEDNFKNLINKYGVSYLSNILNVHRSTLERWKNGVYQIKRHQYNLIEKL